MPYMGAIGFLAAKHGGNVHHQKCNCSIPIKVVKSEGDGNCSFDCVSIRFDFGRFCLSPSLP